MTASILTTIYQIWRSKNTTLWHQQVPTITCVVNNTQRTVKDRIKRIMSPTIVIDRAWFEALA